MSRKRRVDGRLGPFLATVANAVPAAQLQALEIAAGIGRLAARVANETRSADPAGLSATDVDVLVALAGKPGHQATPSDLAGWSGVTNAAITGRVNRLERRGLVRRQVDTKDRRIRWISLTQAGSRFLRNQAEQITDRPLFAAIRRLSLSELRVLARLLRKLS